MSERARLSAWEGLMWRLEQDPFLTSNIVNVSVCDRPLRFASLHRRMHNAVATIPRLRQRIRPSPLALVPPEWVDDVDLDLDRHVCRIVLDPPGDRRTLLDLAARMASTPFDPAHPLWELTAVEGLADGSGALIQKLHHTVADGEGALQLALTFIDFEPDVPDPPAIEIPELHAPAPASVAELGRDLARRQVELPRSVARLASHPARLADTVRSLLAQLGESGPARSPLWTARSTDRTFEVLDLPFPPVRAAAAALGGTVNTALLTVAAAAAGDYHRQLAMPVHALRASMAVSTRVTGEQTNAFTLARFTVPTAEMGIEERFRRIARATASATKAATAASLDRIGQLAAALPTPVVNYLARQQVSAVDFATSNVRSSPVTIHVAGATVEHSYAIGPLGGVAFNLTLQTYADGIDIGLHIDRAAIADPELLRVALGDAFGELLAVNSPPSSPPLTG